MDTPKESHALSENRILAGLPSAQYEQLRRDLEVVRLAQGKILYNAGDTVRYAYFPKGGMLSLLSTTQDGRTIEVGSIGSEGFVGIPVILRVNKAPYQVMVQLPSQAMRIRGDLLREAFNRGGKLQDLLLRYTHTLLSQVTQSATCNRFHTVEERLCRWLLVTHDCAQLDVLALTQEFISHMLGVPRTSVTMIASTLQKSGCIRYKRGRIIILDRRMLEASACECYRLVREEMVTFLAA
ncbi:MAG TPA: Crp/Fnr family transcriptional regulator [Pyrinomonadaceae bacterium]